MQLGWRTLWRVRAAAAAMALFLQVQYAAAGLPGLPTALYALKQTYPHETGCFTEGLFVNANGSVYDEAFESCGGLGRSYLRRYRLLTGETLQTGFVPFEIFAEGVSMLGQRLYMLTYTGSVVLEYSPITMTEVRRHPFPYGEGWGLTTDGCVLYATTGDEHLYRLAPDAFGTLALVGKVPVTLHGTPILRLNEVEYVTPKIWVNQWGTNYLYRVDPVTGMVEVQLDIYKLHHWSGEETPNGVAYSAALLGEMVLLVTGKYWGHSYALQLSADELCGEAASVAPTCALAPRSACWRQTGKAPVRELNTATDHPQVRTAAVATLDSLGWRVGYYQELAATAAFAAPAFAAVAASVACLLLRTRRPALRATADVEMYAELKLLTQVHPEVG